MMTASTPALKPLFGGKTTANSSLTPYNDTYELGGIGRSEAGASARWSKSRNDRKRQSDVAMAYGDTPSEEHILSPDHDISHITKTIDVDVSYDSEGGATETTGELDRDRA